MYMLLVVYQMSCANMFFQSVACLLILFILLIFPHFCRSPTSSYRFLLQSLLRKLRPESGFIAFGCQSFQYHLLGKNFKLSQLSVSWFFSALFCSRNSLFFHQFDFFINFSYNTWFHCRLSCTVNIQGVTVPQIFPIWLWKEKMSL